jgi:hypothetical protein
MDPQHGNFEQHVIDILTAFRTEFPNIEPPAADWLQHWLNRYSSVTILAAIRTLGRHVPQVKARFTQESVGRAISASLRATAIKLAVASAQAKVGGRS